MSDTPKSVWILAKTGYDDFTILGVYSSEALANEQRETVEKAEVEYGDRPRRRSVRDDHYIVEEYELDRCGFELIVRVRKDGEVASTHVHIGYRSVNRNYEPTYEGRAITFDEALAKARSEAQQP